MRDGQIHLVDDDDAVRDSVVFLLESDGWRASAHASPAALLARVQAGLTMTCLVTDVRMPEMDGVELVRRVRAIDPEVPIIVITGHGDVPLAVQAMKAGAADFLEKPFDDQAFLDAVRHAAARKSGEDPAAEGERQAIRVRLDLLSVREREVLQKLVDGHPNKVIAWQLGISPRTVEVYRAKAMTKLGAGSFAELVRLATLAGLDPLDPAAPDDGAEAGLR